MTEQEILNQYRFQLGGFFLARPASFDGEVSWKAGFPGLLAGRAYFFWLQECGDVDLNSQVFGVNRKYNLFEVEIGERAPQIGPDIISTACEFLPTAEQSTESVLYLPESFEVQIAGTLNPLAMLPTLAERPELPPYLDPPGLTYAWDEDPTVLFASDWDLIP
jgi:hypothetical protein